jgi:hypothetical protein
MIALKLLYNTSSLTLFFSFWWWCISGNSILKQFSIDGNKVSKKYQNHEIFLQEDFFEVVL